MENISQIASNRTIMSPIKDSEGYFQKYIFAFKILVLLNFFFKIKAINQISMCIIETFHLMMLINHSKTIMNSHFPRFIKISKKNLNHHTEKPIYVNGANIEKKKKRGCSIF